MRALTPPILQKLEQAKTVLIAGAGGGFDFLSGLPLYFALEEAGKQVHLANLSFSMLTGIKGEWLDPVLLRVTAGTIGHNNYFPEKHLCRWFRMSEKKETGIYCFQGCGVKLLLKGYRALVKRLAPDTIILVDGGTDSLMRGDEDGLGSPCEDVSSITAVNELSVPHKYLACLGFGVDYFHGVSNYLSLKNVAELTAGGGFLGMFSLLKTMRAVEKYMDAVKYVFAHMPEHISIVAGSILASLEGHYGDYHFCSRTAGSRLWINPLMSAYFCFRLEAVAERILYRDRIMETEKLTDILYIISRYRQEPGINIQKREPLPD